LSQPTLRSQAMASSKPPPSARPLTAATVGTGSRWMARKASRSRVTKASASSSDMLLRSFKSAPAQKTAAASSLGSDACTTRQRTRAGSSAHRAASSRVRSSRSDRSARPMAFRFAGRSSSSRATAGPAPDSLGTYRFTSPFPPPSRTSPDEEGAEEEEEESERVAWQLAPRHHPATRLRLAAAIALTNCCCCAIPLLSVRARCPCPSPCPSPCAWASEMDD